MTKMSLPTVIDNPTTGKHKKLNGQWFFDVDTAEYYWKEFTDIHGYKFDLYRPETVENVSREVYFNIIFARLVKDESKFNAKRKVWFKQIAHAKLTEGCGRNIWLIYEPTSKKYFIRDLNELGIVMQMPLFSTDILLFKVSEPEPITFEKMKQLRKETAYVYNSVNLDNSGNISDYVTEC